MLILSQEDVQILYILPVDTIKKEGRSSDLLRDRWNKEIGHLQSSPTTLIDIIKQMFVKRAYCERRESVGRPTLMKCMRVRRLFLENL